MDTIDYNDIGFTWRNIVPEDDDDVTSLWGRKFAKNCFSVYGIVGTLDFPGEIDPVLYYIDRSVNLGLTNKFEYPPFVELYYRNPTTGFLEKFDDSPIRFGISYWIDSNSLIVRLRRAQIFQVYYRILGI